MDKQSPPSGAPPLLPPKKKKTSIFRAGCLMFVVGAAVLLIFAVVATTITPVPDATPLSEEKGRDAFREFFLRSKELGADYAAFEKNEAAQKSLEKWGDPAWNPWEKQQFIAGFVSEYQKQIDKEALEMLEKRRREGR